MSVQLGRWNVSGRPAEHDYLELVKPVLAPYGPDGSGCYSDDSIDIVYHAFHTTKDSCCETQPYVTRSGAVVTWDGRLDNRPELISNLGPSVTASSTDAVIVAAAYERWGTACLAKLLGDWALSIWIPSSASLVLAKDHIGTHHLYYSITKDHVTWSTILDPLVLFAASSITLEEEYIAGWLSSFPAANLTPYVGIHSVPPSSSVLIQAGRHNVTKYWDFDPSNQIRYGTDAEYEDHFRSVFATAVQRRLRSDHPILAELSGGMDSSSIVCMADAVIARGAAETPRLHTVSYYDDSDPNWNERPYFNKVEERRGCIGCHIDAGRRGPIVTQSESDRFASTPGSCSHANEATKQYEAYIRSCGSRVVLSGIGGDEVTGGVPTPTPELEDLIAGAQFMALAHQLKVWALNKRKPWFHLLFEVIREFFPSGLLDTPKHKRPAAWLNSEFVKRNRRALQGYESRIELFGSRPSFQENVNALDAVRRQLACTPLSSQTLYEKRYPYLDRDLLEFLYAVPRQQLVRPGQRRSLMRRALVGIVPDELLNRRRKAYAGKSALSAIAAERAILVEMSNQMVCTSLGIVDAKAFCEAVQKAYEGMSIPIVALMRTIGMEIWLKNIGNRMICQRA